MRRATLTLTVFLLLAAAAQAASPTLGGVSPRGYQRGTDAVFTVTGGRLSDAKDLVFYKPGLAVTKLEVVNDSTVKATVKIAPDAALGEHAVRVRTASGLSEQRTFWVGALPVTDEKEPNSEFATPQKIGMNVTVHGTVDFEDVDYYAVDLKKGQRLCVEIEAMRLAGTLFDPYVAILDTKRFEMATSDDHPLTKQDGLCGIIAPADGTYIIQVRESAYQGNGACQYRLHVGSFPRPQAVVPAGGKAGDEVEVTFTGDPRGPFKQKIKLPNTPGETIRLHAQDAEGIAPTGFPFRVSAFGNVVEVEPNDTVATGTVAPAFPMAFNGNIDKAGDVDVFRFKAKKGETFDVHCYARRIGSQLDPVMTLYNGAGGGITANDDAVGPDSYFRITIPADGDYAVGVTDHLGKGGVNYFYRIEFTPVTPTITLGIPKFAQYSQERQAITVPRGGRMASIITAGRANFGGEMVVSGENMPAGVVLHNENIAGNLDSFPVVFEAAPTAAVSGTLGRLVAKHVDPKHPPVESLWSQSAEFVIGPGQSIMWSYNSDRVAVAVAEEIPYAIDVVEPKAPLVQNGTMQLKIVARRKPGFTAAITVYPVFNPPGVSSASAVTIPANANETFMTINAAANAQVKKWKTAVIAQADAGKGPMWSSSQLFTLDVAAPFVAATMEKSATEQGKETELFVKFQQVTPFVGKATVKLVGLPFKATTTDAEITKDTKEVGFKIVTDKTTPAGIHRNLFCQIVLTHSGETVVASSGYSELRVDVPIVKTTPPPVVKPPTTPVVKTPTPPTPPAPPKRLTRLEMLRKEQEEREKGGMPPK